MRPPPLVACNVYVTAGRAVHGPLLTDILQQSQGRCRGLRRASGPVAVVHAFADAVYDRSSFHLVGSAEAVVDVAGGIAVAAVERLTAAAGDGGDEGAGEPTRHPFVGVVDHVAVMPLAYHDGAEDNTRPHPVPAAARAACAAAAGRIGSALQGAGVSVLRYGAAHPQGLSLATVRRQHTTFFKSGGLAPNAAALDRKGVSTVGAAPGFVENFNIRLRCSRGRAAALARQLRARDGGLCGVEALTLPYADGAQEVACNLLAPHVTPPDALARVAEAWDAAQGGGLLAAAYPVGTTLSQCEGVAAMPSDELECHDRAVAAAFADFLKQAPASE